MVGNFGLATNPIIATNTFQATGTCSDSPDCTSRNLTFVFILEAVQKSEFR
jgi:hypothetical protein